MDEYKFGRNQNTGNKIISIHCSVCAFTTDKNSNRLSCTKISLEKLSKSWVQFNFICKLLLKIGIDTEMTWENKKLWEELKRKSILFSSSQTSWANYPKINIMNFLSAQALTFWFLIIIYHHSCKFMSSKCFSIFSCSFSFVSLQVTWCGCG